jgi:Na+-driven multidrug efflux pump
MAELRSPLVADAPPGEAGEAEDFRDGGRTWRAEARALVGLAVPISLTYLLENLPLSIANVAVGHLGESRFLDATALGFMVSL